MPSPLAINEPPPTDAWFPLRPHPVQQRLWVTRARFAAVVAGRVSGKTEIARRRLVRYLCYQDPEQKQPARYFFGAPTYKQAKRLGWDKLLPMIPRHFIAEVSRSDMRITTIWGNELWVFGMDEPQRVEGTEWSGAVLDESSDLVANAFDISVYPALAGQNGWCWRIGVPKRFGSSVEEYRKFYEDCAAGNYADGEAFTWPSADIQPEATIAHARNHMTDVDFREQFEAHFETVGGRIFHAFEYEYNVRPCPYHPDKPLVIGCDFNVNPMCWVIGHQYQGRFEVIDEIFRRDTNTADTLEFLIGKYGDHEGGFAFFGDATGRARKTAAAITDYLHIENHEGFKKLGRTVHFPRSNPENKDLYACLNALLRNAAGDRRLFISPDAEHVIRDMRLRAYKPGTREASDKGSGQTDMGHMTDALGYPVIKLFPPMLVRDGLDRIQTRAG